MQQILLIAALSYFLGSIPTAYLIAKITKGIDIRKHGSGNPGATNVFRNIGKTAGIVVFLLDFLKGFLAVYLSTRIFGDSSEYMLLSGLFAISGHNWPVWLAFKGGKGVATSAGVVFSILPAAALAGIITFFILLALTKYVSVSSIISSIVVAGITWSSGTNTMLIKTVISLLALLIIIRHRGNIARLLKGEESKFKI